MQLARPFSPQQLNRPHADAQVLVNPLAVKVVGYAGEFDFAMQGLVAHTQQGAVGHAKPEAVGAYRGAVSSTAAPGRTCHQAATECADRLT